MTTINAKARALLAALFAVLLLAGCGTLQAGSTVTGQHLDLVSMTATDEVAASTLPVDLATDTYRTMLRLVVPVDAGDLLDITGWARITNDVGYVVGVGYHLWAYDVDSGQGSSGPWWRISPLNGDNVTPSRHHMPLHIDAVYRVPADWPEGHRIVPVLRADAHSTAWVAGDTLTVDQAYGHLTVRRWTTPAT